MHPALRLLLTLKLRGVLRKQRRRLQRRSGWLFALMGVVLLGVWVVALVAPGGRSLATRLEPDDLRLAVQLGCLVLTVLTLSGAFTHRGLYLPREEIELLFSAPVSRRDLVRYRLLATVGRATFGAVVLALVAMRRMPSPGLASAGVFVAAQTLPLLGQGLAVLLGDAENRLAARLSKLPLRGLQAALVVVVILAFVGLYSTNVFGVLFERVGLEGPGALLRAPWLAALTAPFQPWARAITATSLEGFLPWFALSLAIWLALYEGVSRLPVDYRELSLSTSADVARRLNRRRRAGGGASSSEASRGAARWRVPWLFGRGPGGAIAWRKTGSILRKARGTLLTSLLVVGGLTVASLAIDRGREQPDGVPGSLLIAVVGTLYLCAGLRFDFREDLDAMETLKAWPVRPWRVFLATLLPEVVLVSALLVAAIVVRAVALGVLGPIVLGIAAGIPVTVLLWAGIDNAVFLYMPVRQTPGQEGALHHVGRTMVLLLLRMLAMALVVAGAAASAGLHWLLGQLGQPSEVALAGAIALLVLVVAFEVGAVVLVGGAMLRRFDLARDTG